MLCDFAPLQEIKKPAFQKETQAFHISYLKKLPSAFIGAIVSANSSAIVFDIVLRVVSFI